MSPLPFGILNSSGSIPIVYRLQALSGSLEESFDSTTVDSLGNIYAVGRRAPDEEGTTYGFAVKYNSLGNIEWQRQINPVSSSEQEDLRSVATDSLNNVYMVGSSESYFFSGSVLFKYNSSGTLQWQRVLGQTNSSLYGSSVAIDSFGDVYVVGSHYVANPRISLVKYNSSGILQWQRSLDGASTDLGNDILVDSLNNIYILGTTYSSGAGSQDMLLAKYNSSGTIQWQRTLGDAGFNSSAKIAADSLGNIYILGTTSTYSGSNSFMVLVKYNSSGTVQWQKLMGRIGSNTTPHGIAVDSANNVYITGFSNFYSDMLLAKYNSSGTLQWQRILGVSTGVVSSRHISLDSSGNLYVSGTINTGTFVSDAFLAVLPNDGSRTGTHILNGVSLVYQASDLIDQTISLSSNASNLTSSTTSLSDQSSSLPITNISLTPHRVNI